MPRLNVIDPQSATGEAGEILNGPLKGKTINIFKGLANHPPVLKAFLGFMQGVKRGGKLSEQEHEIIALITAEHNDCQYCTAAHTTMAMETGLGDEAVMRIRRGQADDPRHQALIDFTHSVLDSKGYVTPEQLDAFHGAGYDDAAVVELVGAITVNTFTNLFNHVNETEIDFPVPAAVG